MRAVGNRTGLLSDVRFSAPPRGSEQTVTAAATPASLRRTIPLSVDRDPSLGLGGKGETVGEAATTLLGEFFERYCAFHPIGEAFDRTTATYTELRDRGERVVPAEFLDVVDQSKSESVGFRAFDRETEIDWIRGRRTDGRGTYVPVERVSLAYQIERTLGDAQPHFYASSNGTACGSTLEGAILRSLYELVERDALMRVWYTQTSPPVLDVDDQPTVAAVLDRVSSDSTTHTLVDLGGVADVPVVGAIVTHDESTAPNFLIAASASLDPVSAARDALVESTQGYRHFEKNVARTGLVDGIDPTKQANLWACPQLYARPEAFDHVSFLLDGTTSELPAGDRWGEDRRLRAELEALLDRLHRHDFRPIVVDVTTPDVRSLGMHVTRVLAPRLVDLVLPAIPPIDHPAFDDGLATEKGHPIA